MHRSGLAARLSIVVDISSRDRVFNTAIRLNPASYERRRVLAEEHRGQLITTGPNEVWSIDAYCKFEL